MDFKQEWGPQYNEVGGQDLFTEEPIEQCPKCGGPMHANWVDNGFGRFSVQVDPFRCDNCGHVE